MNASRGFGMGWAASFTLAAGLTAGAGLCRANGMAETPMAQAVDGQDAHEQSDLASVLKGKRFRGVVAHVSNGAVTLTGTVDLYQDKMDAEKKAYKVAGPATIQDDVQVGGPQVPDLELGQKLAGKLAIDGLNPNLTQYEYFSVSVQAGVVTLNGFALDPANKDWATGEIATTPGVKGLVNNIEVAPPSPNDFRVRLGVAQAIYNDPIFTKYAFDPTKPIRILVLNGNVTLAGQVSTKSDSDVAALRANGVRGTFTVTNNLRVTGAEY